ncbi:MAG TPA: DUF1549 domain-containing protein, partial [Planctomycetota bacterium]|nr:DUF1549 domain-containing protein [Planctomycetota bacterium]
MRTPVLAALLLFAGSDRSQHSAEAHSAKASDPIAALIDRHFEAQWAAAKIVPAKLANDYEFFRRLSLDVLGRLPKPDEVKAFVADPSPKKRAEAVDRMLASD